MEFKKAITRGDIFVIELNEDHVDASNVREFRETIHILIKQHSRVVFNMNKIKFVDSSGLGAMISCQRLLNVQHGEFRLCNMTGSVKALFELMRMERVFFIHETQEQALNAFDKTDLSTVI
jgi:anti-sigma B factor antagonist